MEMPIFWSLARVWKEGVWVGGGWGGWVGMTDGGGDGKGEGKGGSLCGTRHHKTWAYVHGRRNAVRALKKLFYNCYLMKLL